MSFRKSRRASVSFGVPEGAAGGTPAPIATAATTSHNPAMVNRFILGLRSLIVLRCSHVKDKPTPVLCIAIEKIAAQSHPRPPADCVCQDRLIRILNLRTGRQHAS